MGRGATVIFCETTPIPEGVIGRVMGDSKKYNEIARKVMEEEDIPVNELYNFALTVPTILSDVNYTPENGEKLARYLAEEIKKKLKD